MAGNSVLEELKMLREIARLLHEINFGIDEADFSPERARLEQERTRVKEERDAAVKSIIACREVLIGRSLLSAADESDLDAIHHLTQHGFHGDVGLLYDNEHREALHRIAIEKGTRVIGN